MTTGQRIKPEEALDNFRRGQIHGYLRANPGTHYNELKRVLDMPNGVLSYHLRILEDKGFIQHRKEGLRLRFYLDSYPMPELTGLTGREEEIVDIVNDNPGCSQQHLAETVGMRPAAISYFVRQLTKRGVVRIEREGRQNAVYLTAATA